MDSLVDLAEVRRLIEIAQRHGLEGLTVTRDEVEISITVGWPCKSEERAAPDRSPSRAPEPTEDLGSTRLVRLTSPITGVFYRSPSPNQPPFVEVGDRVEEHDTVCLIEAMKIFNEIPAGVHGRLVRVVAANEQLVVTGEVLMEFEPLGDRES